MASVVLRASVPVPTFGSAESGRIPKGAFVRCAMQLLSVTVQRGNAEMYRRSGLVISREQGLRYDAGLAVPVLMS